MEHDQNKPIEESTPSYDDVELQSSPSLDRTILDLSTDLDNLSFEEAKDYVVTIMTVKKDYKKQILNTETELSKLNDLKVANPSDSLTLDNSISENQNKLHRLKTEDMELSMKLDQLKVALEKKKDEIPLSNNPKALLEGLETLVGKTIKDMEFEKETEKLSLEDKLKNLKRKMDQNQ